MLLVTVLDGAQQLTTVNKNCILDDPAGVFIPSVLQYWSSNECLLSRCQKKKKKINSLQGIAATVQVEYTEMFPQQTKANCN